MIFFADLFSRVFSKLFARGPHKASRSNHGSSHPYSRNYRTFGW